MALLGVLLLVANDAPTVRSLKLNKCPKRSNELYINIRKKRSTFQIVKGRNRCIQHVKTESLLNEFIRPVELLKYMNTN